MNPRMRCCPVDAGIPGVNLRPQPRQDHLDGHFICNFSGQQLSAALDQPQASFKLPWFPLHDGRPKPRQQCDVAQPPQEGAACVVEPAASRRFAVGSWQGGTEFHPGGELLQTLLWCHEGLPLCQGRRGGRCSQRKSHIQSSKSLKLLGSFVENFVDGSAHLPQRDLASSQALVQLLELLCKFPAAPRASDAQGLGGLYSLLLGAG
mmetsp:Transcript_99012/g.206386  ORF Transcript_99012/g.206386 Transcript_99012/m.206386 type:complete len:206 (+) Transcript_99012:863-1480(+)